MRNIILFFILSLIACKHRESKKTAFDFYPDIKDSIQKKYLLSQINDNAALFNLPVIYRGVDSFEIRVTLWHAFDRGVNLFVFKLDSPGWSGFRYYIKSYRVKRDGIKINAYGEEIKAEIPFMTLSISPKCGWRNFEDSINFYGIKSLPTQDSIRTYPHTGSLDGPGYIIEIAAKKSYRHLDYHFYESDSHDECQNIYGFVSMLQRQLDDAYFWPEKNPIK
jgi:hypothetical protein